MLFEFGGLFRKVWRGALLLGTLVIGTNALFVTPVSAAAGINQQLNFQGRLLNAQGAIVVDGYYNVEFKIYQDGTGTVAGNPSGTLLWTEDWLNSNGSPVKVVNGYMSVQLGSINPFGNSIDWNQDTIWLSLNIGNTTSCTITTNFTANCGGDGEMLPMKRMSAVPYSLNSARLGGLTSADFIQNTTTVQAGANLAIGGTARADTSILTPAVDTNAAVALNIGTTNATAINLNQNVTVAAGKSLTLAGGNTASRPASPTEGMVYYDTTTKQLLTYSNGKWQADRNSSTKIVAASNASQALKDGADYVATGTGDQSTIQSALDAAAGGRVYLTEGTFNLSGAIQIRNNTALAGAGTGTIITIPNGQNGTYNMVTNFDTSTGTNIVIRDLKIDGNKAGQTGGSVGGIYFDHMGGSSGTTARTGGTITNVTVANTYAGTGILLSLSNNNTITNTSVQNTGGSGIRLTNSGYNTFANNFLQGNSTAGIYFDANSFRNAVSNNNIQANSFAGVYLYNSNDNIVTGNNISDSGTTTNNNAIYVDGTSTRTSVTNNTLVDTSPSSTNYAINITASAANTYLSNNLFSSTSTTSTINDLSGTTTYANQSRSEGGAKLTNRTANDSEAFTVQNAAGANIFAVDTSGSQVVLGNSSAAGKLTINDGSGHTGTIVMGTVAGNYTYTVPTTTANDSFCLVTLGNCAADSTLFIQNQNAAQQATSKFWISGTGRADTSILTPLLDAATSATALNIGTTNASVINLNQNVTVAAGKSLTLTGSGTRPASPTEGMLYFDTTTHQLLQWNGTKWVNNGSGVYLVAASNSSQADKDAADYVATGTNDHTPIQNALDRADPASAVSGARKSGKVYLFAGTYTLGGTISVPNNTTLAGAGSGTLITIPNSVNATFTAITNTTTGGNGTGVVIQDLKLDGNKAGQGAGNYGMYGITFNGMGSSTLQGGKILNVWVNNWYGNGAFLWTYSGIYISAGQRNTVSNATVQGNTNNGITITGTYNTITGSDFTGNNYGIHLVANNNTVTGNSASANTAIGIYLETASQNTITGNVATGNTNQNIYLLTSNSNTVSGNQALGSSASDGIGLASTSTYNIISSNIIQANSAGGVALASSSANNTITGNKIHNNGGNNNKGVYFNNASSNTITNNTITDTANSASNNPINIDVNSANTYLSGNTFSSTAANGTIADASTTTVYVNQAKAEGGGQITNRVANDTAAFTFQKADGTNVLTVDTTNSKVLIAGTLDTTTATTLSIGTATATAITIGKAGITTTIAGDTGVTLNATTGTTMVCRNATGLLSTCDATYVAPTTTNFIQNQVGTPGTPQTGNFNITGTGIAATLQATSVLGTTLDTASGVALEIGTTNATVINLNENVTVAAGKSLTMVGGNTASRPASPSEGMMYYDTDTKQMLQWNGVKWVNSGSESYLVAASNSSQADKDAADYVATGTADQTTIQSAIDRADPASAISGARKSGKVCLFAGTYTTNDVISITNDTTLSGAGRGSVIKFANINGQTKNMITNTDTTTGKGVTVRDLQLDGNNTVNTSGTMYGIYFNGMGGASGASARQGANIINNWVNNFFTNGIYLNGSPNSTIIGNNVQGNSGNGIYISSSNRSNITNNISQGNGGSGIVLAGAISENVVANTFAVNSTAGVYINGGSNNNTIFGNNFYNNGGNTANNSIHFPAAANGDFNTITNNTINDTAGSTSNYAINFVDNTSNNNYLADNVFTSTLGTSTINDPAGTNNVYSNQPRAEGGAQITNRTVNDTAAFTFQKADGTNVLTVDTTNNKVLVAGAVDTTTATTLSIGTATANAISIGSAAVTTTIAGNTGVTLNATTGTTMVCRNATGLLSTCDATYLTPTATNFIQNSTSLQASSNFHISGTGQADTALISPSLRAATDGTASIKLQNAAGTVTALTVDTTNNRVGIGTATTPSTTFHVGVNNSSATSTVALLEQQGTGNTTLQLKNPSESWNLGVDSSDGNAFKITTATTAAATTTFGNTTSGNLDNADDNNFINAGKYTASATGNVVSLSVYVACTISASPNNQFRMAIFSDSGAGTTPSTLLGQSAAGTLVTGWNQVSIPATAVTNGTVYWIAYNSNGTNINQNCFRTTTGVGANSSVWTSGYAFGSMPASWPGNAGNDTAQPSFYATVQTSAGTNTYTNSLFQMTTNGRVTLHNSLDSTSAFQIQNAAGTAIMNVDTTNSKVLVAGTIDTTTATTLTVGNSTATAITIGKSSIATTLSSSTINVGTSGSTTNILGATQTTNNTAGNSMIIRGSTGLGSGNGGAVTLQGGNGGATGTLGGNLTLAGGTGTTSNGTVILATSTFQTATTDANCFPSGTERTTNSDCTIAQSSVNNNASVIVGFTNDGLTAFMPDPSIVTAGRVVYVTASNGTKDFTLSVNGGGQGNQIAMRKNTTATMIWNGADWTAAGASSSTTMQAAYDNTLQSAGGAELVVSKTSATNGLTIRDSLTNSVNGALLTVQSSSAANLFSVNSNVTEYATDAGAEVYGASTSTFPANTWSALTATTITRYTTAGDYIATGQGSVSANVTSATANAGVANRLSTTLTANMTYNVSFSTRLLSGTFTDMSVAYSIDGTTGSPVACAANQTAKTSVWTKINCTFTAPSSGITANNAILIRQATGVIRTFYVDNLSVTIAADYNLATDGSVDDNTNFGTNWTLATAGSATGTMSRDTLDGNDASSSAKVTTLSNTANAGIRNKLSISPLQGTLYRVSVYAKVASGTFTDFKVRYSATGAQTSGAANYIDCVDYNSQTITTTQWTQITCYIKTDATTVTTPYIYFVQTAAPGSTRTFSVDTFSMTLASNTTPNVQIGSGSNGGPTTLFTLDKGASAPIAANNDALLGSMYYDTTLGKLQCYEADGWGACGSSPDNIVTISPEYTNAVMHGTGVGTMTSDMCSDALNINDPTNAPAICGANETYNFYKWTSPQPTPQTYSIYVTYQLPTTFKSFASGQTSLMGKTDSANSTVTYQVYRNSSSGLSPCGTPVSVSTGVQASWITRVATGAADPSTCGFAAGDSVVFQINITASSNANAYVGNLGFTFSNK